MNAWFATRRSGVQFPPRPPFSLTKRGFFKGCFTIIVIVLTYVFLMVGGVLCLVIISRIKFGSQTLYGGLGVWGAEE